MTGVGYRVDLSGQAEALAAFGAIVSRLDHPQPMYEDIGASLVTSTQKRFEDGRAPDGNPWPPSMRVRAHGGKTLVLSRRLELSQTSIASDNGVEVGTNVVYAAIHQLGGVIQKAAHRHTTYRKYDARKDELSTRFVKKSKSNFAEEVTIPAHSVTIPARPFLGLDDDDLREIVLIAESFVGDQDADRGGVSP